MNFIRNIIPFSLIVISFLFIGCEGNYEHKYVVDNVSSQAITFLKQEVSYVQLDSVNYYDSLYVDTITIKPNQQVVIYEYDDFGNLPRKQENCFYQNYKDTIYNFNNNSYKPLFLFSSLPWQVTDYNKKLGQTCTTIITNELLEEYNF